MLSIWHKIFACSLNNDLVSEVYICHRPMSYFQINTFECQSYMDLTPKIFTTLLLETQILNIAVGTNRCLFIWYKAPVALQPVILLKPARHSRLPPRSPESGLAWSWCRACSGQWSWSQRGERPWWETVLLPTPRWRGCWRPKSWSPEETGRGSSRPWQSLSHPLLSFPPILGAWVGGK